MLDERGKIPQRPVWINDGDLKPKEICVLKNGNGSVRKIVTENHFAETVVYIKKRARIRKWITEPGRNVWAVGLWTVTIFRETAQETKRSCACPDLNQGWIESEIESHLCNLNSGRIKVNVEYGIAIYVTNGISLSIQSNHTLKGEKGDDSENETYSTRFGGYCQKQDGNEHDRYETGNPFVKPSVHTNTSLSDHSGECACG